jgi:hypothetical protein
MRNLNTTITAIRFISNPNHLIRPFCLNSTKLDEYALQPAVPNHLFVRAMECLGNGNGMPTDRYEKNRRPSTVFQSTMDKNNRFDYELCAIRRGASNERFQAETFCILNEKYKKHSKIYTDGSNKDEKVEYARPCRSKD